MFLRPIVRIGITALAVSVLTAHGQATGAISSGVYDAVAIRVAQDASTELALTPDAETVAPGDVRIDSVIVLGKRLRVYRAWVARDHWHAYQVGVVGDTLIPLGGFQNPDLVTAAAKLPRQIKSSPNIRATAERLALLGDGNGAVQYLFRSKTYRTTWRNLLPDPWPPDTMVNLRNGNVRAVITILSQDSHSYTQSWTPVAYAFTFDHTGQLLAWASRRGGPIAAARVQALKRD